MNFEEIVPADTLCTFILINSSKTVYLWREEWKSTGDVLIKIKTQLLLIYL